MFFAILNQIENTDLCNFVFVNEHRVYCDIDWLLCTVVQSVDWLIVILPYMVYYDIEYFFIGCTQYTQCKLYKEINYLLWSGVHSVQCY